VTNTAPRRRVLDNDALINRGFDETMQRIKNLVEGDG